VATAAIERPRTAPAGARAIVGVRVSAVGERDHETATSAPDQRKWGTATCAAREWPIVGTAEDLSVPGDVWNERRGLWAGVEAIERGEADVLLYQTTKRLARDVELGFHVKRRVEAAGGWLVLGDCPDGAPSAMLGLMLGTGEDDHAEKKSYLRVAKQRALDRGDYLARRPPIGYVWNQDAGEERDPELPARALVPGPAAGAVAEAFRLRAAGASDSELAAFLERETGSAYDPRSIAGIFRNRAYRGERVYAGETTSGTHAAIVSEEEWVAGQRVARRRIKRSGTKSLLAGIARCASCGRKLSYDASGSAPTYRCPRDHSRPKCPAPASIKADVLDDYVWSEAVKWAYASGEADQPISAGLDDQLAAARALVREAEADLDAWAEDSAGLKRETVQKGLQARQERLQAAERRAAMLEDVSAAAGARVTFRELLAEDGSGLRAPLETAERRQLLASIIERVDVRRGVRFQAIPVGERAQIVWIED